MLLDGGLIDISTYRVREKDNPAVANELMKVDGTSGGLSIEVGGNGTQTKATKTKRQHGNDHSRGY